MNKQDIDLASSSLAGAINYFKPTLEALNQANSVFSVLRNAIDHKTSLERDVDALLKQSSDLQADVDAKTEAITKYQAISDAARLQSLDDVQNAKAAADAEVADIKADIKVRTKDAKAAFAAKMAEFDDAIAKATADHNSIMADMGAQQDELQKQITDLEAKLEDVKSQAQKFASTFAVLNG